MKFKKNYTVKSKIFNLPIYSEKFLVRIFFVIFFVMINLKLVLNNFINYEKVISKYNKTVLMVQTRFYVLVIIKLNTKGWLSNNRKIS